MLIFQNKDTDKTIRITRVEENKNILISLTEANLATK
jgi:hypothetical protein